MTICDENQVFKAALHYLPSTEDQLPILYFKHLLNNFLKKLADIAEFKFHNEKRACEGSNLILEHILQTNFDDNGSKL